jgi:hypothetical protein
MFYVYGFKNGEDFIFNIFFVLWYFKKSNFVGPVVVRQVVKNMATDPQFKGSNPDAAETGDICEKGKKIDYCQVRGALATKHYL